MVDIRDRASRLPRFFKVVVAIVVGGVTIVSAVVFWSHLLGWLGVGILAGLVVALLLAVMLLPDRLWSRLTTDSKSASRGTAIQALQDRLAESDAIRTRLFQELPTPEEMKARTERWADDAFATVIAHAPDYRADFNAHFSVPLRLYMASDGMELSAEQGRVIGRFDVMRDRVKAILEAVRSG